MTTQQFTVPELLDIFGVTKEWLIEETELSPGTIERNLDMSPEGLKTHWTTALAIGEAFGVDYEKDIKWPRGLTDNGRTALSGKLLTLERTFTVTLSEKVVIKEEPLCPRHHTVLPKTGKCDDCA